MVNLKPVGGEEGSEEMTIGGYLSGQRKIFVIRKM
jgi:hypothetical protein